MYIDNLTVKDFCNIQEREFQFAPGINLITGTNGSGKSSILKALSYLLLNSTDKTIADYVNWFAKGFDLSLQFRVDNIPARMFASYDGRSSSKDLEYNGELYKNSEATGILAQKFDPTLCKYSSFSSQGDLDFIYATPSVRRDLLKMIYSLEFDNQLEAVETAIADLTEKIQECTTKIVQYEVIIDSPLMDTVVVPYSSSEIEDMKHQLQLLEENKSALQEKYTLLKSAFETYTERKQELGKRSSALMTERDRIVSTLVLNTSILQASTLDNSPIESRIKEYEDELATIVIRRIPDTNPFAEEVLVKQKLVTETNTRLNIAQKNYSSMSSGICPTCKQAYPEDQLVSTRSELEQLQADLHTVTAELNSAMDKSKEFLHKKQENDLAKERKASLEASINSLRLDMEKKKNEYTTRIAQAQARIEEYEAAFERIKTEIETVTQQIESLSEVPPPNSIVEELRPIEGAITTIHAKIEDYTKAVAINEKVESHNAGIRQKVAEAISLLDKMREQINIYTAEIEVYNQCKSVLKKDLPNYILERLAIGLETSANEFLDRAYNGRYHVKLVESKSGIDVVYGDKDKSVVLASGAEKSLINLGIKLGLAKLSGMGVLFLDEVDAYMADDIALEVFEIFEELIAEKFIDQIFVISHKETVKELLEDRFKATVFVM